MLSETPLWVDVYDASWNRLGDGPVPLTSASVTRAFDGAGSFSFEAPATDERVITLLKDQRRVKIFYNDPQTNIVRQIGSGIISKRPRKYSASGSQKSFSGTDVLDELVNFIALPNTIFSNQSVADVASTLAARAGWQAETESGISNLISARYDGASILKCLRTMTEKVGLHLREKVDVPSDRDHIIEIGRFRTDIGLYIQNGEAFTSRVFDNSETAFIDSLTITHESSEIVNWIIPIGSGEGESALTLEKAARSATYSRETLVNNGKTLYFKRNEVSIAKYGVKQKMLTVKDVAPVGNSDTAIGYAADVLDEAADVFLDRNGEPQTVYKLSIKKGSKLIRPGDLVHLSFRGLVRDLDGQEIPDEIVEGDFYVLSVTENVSASGVTLSLEISDVDKLPLSEEAFVLDAIEDVNLRNLSPNLTTFGQTYSRFDYVQNWSPGGGQYVKHATFNFKVDSKFTDIYSVSLDFETKPLEALSYAEDVVGGTTPRSAFAILTDTRYPNDISLWVDGTDVSSLFGGPWEVGGTGTNAVIQEDLDITDLLKATGLFQKHVIQVRCGARTGQVGFPGFTFSSPYASHGRVDVDITVIGTVQGIRP